MYTYTCAAPSSAVFLLLCYLRVCDRLIHCLLLGHLSSLPTLDDLRSMRRAFSLKDSSASRLSTGALVSRPSSGKGVIVGTQTSAVPEQTPTLRIAQRHLSGIRLWFEEEEEEEDEEEDGTRGKEAEEQSRRGAACTCGTLASTIKTVYTEAWGEDDGRLGGLDLLLTLCAAPDSRAPEITSIGADAANGGDTGEAYSWFVVRWAALSACYTLVALQHDKPRRLCRNVNA